MATTRVPSTSDERGELPALSSEEIERYSRHLLLDEVGLEGQRRLKASSVLCVGTGGLGSPVLMYLAAAGVGRIGLVDFDVVDASNLQRQVIHGTSTLGTSKVRSAKERILEINPNIRVDVYEVALTSENALRILEPYDVVVDGTDNFPTRYLVNDACVILGKPYIYGSIFKFEGQASVFNLDGGPNYRDLYPEPPPPGLVPSCAEGGVLGVLPGVIGTIQATETIKILLGTGTSLSGRLLLYDALDMRFRELTLRRDPSAEPITTLIDYVQFCGGPAVEQELQDTSDDEPFARITATEARSRLDTGWSPVWIDVRRPQEWDIAKLALATHFMPHERISELAGELPHDHDIVLQCKSGGRSARAAATLAALGFTRLYSLEGGINGWARDVDPTLPTY